MAKVYANLIKNKTINPKTGNEWKIEDVPSGIRDEVERLLNPNS